MKAAAKALEFEKAAVLRDQLIELRQVMALKEPGQRDLSLELVEQSVQRPKRRS
jgi:excinuclease UvrABC nuclease subunit